MSLRGATSDPYFIIFGEVLKEGTVNKVQLAKSEVVKRSPTLTLTLTSNPTPDPNPNPSQVVKRIRNPQWEPLRWSTSQLNFVKGCEALRIEVYDSDRLSADDLIGSAQLVLPLLDVPIELDLNPITLLNRKGKAAGRVEGVVALCPKEGESPPKAASSATFEVGEQ